MAHQISALHQDGFVRVGRATRERLSEVNMVALGLFTELSSHADGFPVTLEKIIKRARKPGADLLREAYRDLIAERLVVEVKYGVQVPGKRPYPASTTFIVHQAITDDEFAESIVQQYTPGSWVLDKQSDGEVRKVKVTWAKVRYWSGEKHITAEGELSDSKPSKKPGPQRGAKVSPPSKKKEAGQHENVDSGEPSSTMTSENGDGTSSGVDSGEPSSTMTSENEASSQRNVELGEVESTTSSSLTRPGDEITNQTSSDVVGGSDEPKKAKRDTRPDTRGARFLEALVLPDRTKFGTRVIQQLHNHVDELLASGWTEQGLTAEVTADTGRVDSWRKIARYRITHLRPLAPQLQQDTGDGHAPAMPRNKHRLWCKDCDGQTITVDGTRARICSDDCPHAPSTADVAALQQELAAPEQEQPESHGATSAHTGAGADGASLPPEIEKVTGQLAGTLSLNNN